MYMYLKCMIKFVIVCFFPRNIFNYSCQIETANRPFAASHSRGTKPAYWRANVGLGQDKQKAYIILNGNFLCLSCPSATFALQYGGFVPRDRLAAKGLLM